MPFNHLYILYKLYPDITWTNHHLAKNDSLTWDMVNDICNHHPDLYNNNSPWKINFKFNRKVFTWEMIKTSYFTNLDGTKGDMILWDWKCISMYDSITCDVIRNNQVDDQGNPIPWDWDSMSRNKNITWDFIKENIHKPWNWVYLSCHNAITCDIIRNNQVDDQGNPIPWNWDSMSRNKNITWDFIKENIHKPWNWETISWYKVTWEIIRDNQSDDEKIPIPWNWKMITINDNITEDIIKNNLFFKDGNSVPWHLDMLIFNPNMKWKFIKENIHHCNFKLYQLCRDWLYAYKCNPNITYKVIRDNRIINNIEIPWNDKYNKIWDWDDNIYNTTFKTYKYKKLSFDDIKRKIGKKLHDYTFIEGISRNKNLTWDIVAENLTYIDEKTNEEKKVEWDWGELSKRKFITWKIVRDHIDEDWLWYHLSKNDMNIVNKAIIIQRWWKKHSPRKKIRKIYNDVMIELLYKPRIGKKYKKQLKALKVINIV